MALKRAVHLLTTSAMTKFACKTTPLTFTSAEPEDKRPKAPGRRGFATEET